MCLSQDAGIGWRMTQLALSLFRPKMDAPARRRARQANSCTPRPLAYRLLVWAFRNN